MVRLQGSLSKCTPSVWVKLNVGYVGGAKVGMGEKLEKSEVE